MRPPSPSHAGRPSSVPTWGLLLALLAVPAARAQDTALILTSDLRPESLVAADELAAELLEIGITAEIVVSLFPAGDPGDLSDHACVFDLHVDTPLDPFLDMRLRPYLAGGGGAYLAGEHATFAFRNDSLTAFMNSMGAGFAAVNPVGFPALGPTDIVEPTNVANSLSHDCNEVTELVFDGIENGEFTAFGTGDWVSGTPFAAGAANWDVGTIPDAPAGRVIIVLDINWLSTGVSGTLDFRVEDPSIPTQNRAFVENMVRWLCTPDFSCSTTCEPRNHGYWHRFCLGTDTIDPGRNGQGNGPGPHRDTDLYDDDLVAGVDSAMAPHGIGACEALDEGPFSDPMKAALRELATLQFNLVSKLLSGGCPVELHPVDDAEGLTVSDAKAAMEARIADGSEGALREAVWIGEHVNNGEALK